MATPPLHPLHPVQNPQTTNEAPVQPLKKEMSKWDKILEFFTGTNAEKTQAQTTAKKSITDKNLSPNSPAATSSSIARKKILELMNLEMGGKEIKIAPRELLDAQKIKELEEKWNKNLDKISLLKAHIDQREQEISTEGLLSTISHYFAKKMGWSLSNQADQLYQKLYNQLSPEQKQEVDQLSKTYVKDKEIADLGKYEGLLKDDKPYGYGTLTAKDFICKGHFSYSDFEGAKTNNSKSIEKGIFTLNFDLVRGIKKDIINEWNGEFYQGGTSFKGTHLIKGGFKEEGFLTNEKLNGYGKQSVGGNTQHPFESGLFYEGNFIDGKPDGSGRLVDKNGVILKEGVWKDGLFEDEVSYSPPKKVESIEVRSLFPETKEMVNIENVGKYSGSLVSENILTPHGQGRLIRPDGSICYGKFDNGNFIEGEYIRQGKPPIIGTFSGEFKDGFLTEGTIKTKRKINIKNLGDYNGILNEVGIPHGRGYLERSDGSICSGEFSNGNFIKGKFTRVDGTSVYGEFLGNDFENGLMKTGTIKNTELLSDKEFLSESGSFDKQLRLDGIGRRIINDRINMEGQFKFGKPHGYVQTKASSKDGNILIQGVYDLGEENGNRKASFSTGTVIPVPTNTNEIDGLIWDFKNIKQFNNETETYLGTLNEKGEPHGKGTLFKEDGSRCTGEFENGTFIKGATTKYTEELVDGKFKQTSETTQYEKS